MRYILHKPLSAFTSASRSTTDYLHTSHFRVTDFHTALRALQSRLDQHASFTPCAYQDYQHDTVLGLLHHLRLRLSSYLVAKVQYNRGNANNAVNVGSVQTLNGRSKFPRSLAQTIPVACAVEKSSYRMARLLHEASPLTSFR